MSMMPGQHRHLGQVDHAGIRRLALHLRERADGLDPLPFHQNADVRLHLLGTPIHQATRLDQHLLGRGRCLHRQDGHENECERVHRGSKGKRDGRTYSRPVTHTT